MPSNRLSNRISHFRFSLRLPISPVSPRFTNTNDQSLSICHSSRSPSPDEKNSTNIGVHIVDSDDHRALPTPGTATSPSPPTPWHASFHRNAATTNQETTYLKRTTHLRYARLLISTLLLALGITLTALNAHILSHYHKTHLSANWNLNLWPTDLNLTPTLITLVTGILATFLSLLAIAVSLVPGPSPRTKLNNGAFTLLTGITAPLSLISIIVSGALSPHAIFGTFVSSTITSLVTTTGPSHTIGLTPNGAGGSPKAETIQSFTCAISNTAGKFNGDAVTLGLPSLSSPLQLAPRGFGGLCGESKASAAVVICVVILALGGLGVAGWGWVVERGINKFRAERGVESWEGEVGGLPYEDGKRGGEYEA